MTATTTPTPTVPAEGLLRVTGLTKHFPVRGGLLRRRVGAVRAVQDVDLELRAGETFGLVGESGCGKTTTGRLIARLLPATSGRIVYDGADVTAHAGAALRELRTQVQIVFQDPYSSLSPRMTVHDIVAEPLRVHRRYADGGREAVDDLLALVGLGPDAGGRYPHEFSGGQRQRVGIARALALQPRLLVLDEPVSALDVSIQAQVIGELRDLQARLGLTYLFISHDLSVVRHVCDRVAVMYLGRIVEAGTRAQIFGAPRHPYTRALLAAAPVAHPAQRGRRPAVLAPGELPDPAAPPSGCAFRTRCPKARELCARELPPLTEHAGTGQRVACHFPEEHGPEEHGPAGHGAAGHGAAGHGPAGHGPAGRGPAGHGPAGHGPAGVPPARKGL